MVTAYGRLEVRSYLSARVNGAVDVSVKVNSRMALFTSRIHMAVSKRRRITMVPNIVRASFERFRLIDIFVSTEGIAGAQRALTGADAQL